MKNTENKAVAPMMVFNQFSSAALAVSALPPRRVVRLVSMTICILFGLALVYAYFAQMDIVVTAQGKVIPAGKSKVVQPLESGVVRAIAVRDGQAVKAGDVLIELDLTNSGADRDRLKRELWEVQAEEQRARALLDGRSQLALPAEMPREIVLNQTAMLKSRQAEQRAKLAGLAADLEKRRADSDAIESGLRQQRNALPLVSKKLQMREELAKTGHVSQLAVIEAQLDLGNAERDLAVQGNRLTESRAAYDAATEQRSQSLMEFQSRASGELLEAVRKRSAAEQELIKANQRLATQTLRAPIDGVVQQLSVTTVGGVVTAAQPLMTIVPEHLPFELEAQVLNRDIGHVRVGQRVINKVETFDFTRYGYLDGEVLWVGTDAVLDPKLGLVYPVRIRLTQTQTPTAVNGRNGVIKAGMSVTSDIRTDQRRMIEYLLAPMLRYSQEALRER